MTSSHLKALLSNEKLSTKIAFYLGILSLIAAPIIAYFAIKFEWFSQASQNAIALPVFGTEAFLVLAAMGIFYHKKEYDRNTYDQASFIIGAMFATSLTIAITVIEIHYLRESFPTLTLIAILISAAIIFLSFKKYGRVYASGFLKIILTPFSPILSPVVAILTIIFVSIFMVKK